MAMTGVSTTNVGGAAILTQTFFADEKFGDVIEVLIQRGWSLNSSPDQPADLFWRNLSNTPFDRCNENTFVNHLEGAQHLSNKGKFTRLLGLNAGGRGDPFLPRAHALDPPPKTVKRSLSGEAKLTLSIETMLRDLITQLSVGVLKHISQSGTDFVYNNEVVSACIGICERWVRQLRELYTTDAFASSNRVIRRPCAPGREVVIVGGAIWELITSYGYSVHEVVSSIEVVDVGASEESVDMKQRVNLILHELQLLDTHYHLGGAGIWIVKPSGMSCGQGILCLDSIPAVAEACAQLEFKAVVQKYIERPLLVSGRKFDVRLWVLVTSVTPLVVYAFSDCYLRFSSKPYQLDQLNDRLVHLCNYSVQKTGNNEVESSHESASDMNIEENMATSRAFALFIDTKYGVGTWFHLLHQIRISVLSSINACKTHLKKRGRGFEWLGFDYMVAEEEGRLRPYVIEANTSPDVSHSTKITAALVPVATSDMLKLVMDEGDVGLELEESRRSCLLKHSESENLSHQLCFPDEACWQLWSDGSDNETDTPPEVVIPRDDVEDIGTPEDRSMLPPRNFSDLCKCLPQLQTNK